MRHDPVRLATMRAAFAIAALMALSPRTALGQDSGIGIAIGATPARVQLEDLDGNPVDLGNYIGKRPVLLEFWATWCPVCRGLEPRLNAARERYGDRVEFLIIGVAVSQTPRQIKRHLENHALPGRVLYDTQGRAVRAFQAPTTSFVVILDRNGRVTYTGSGEDQPLLEALAKVAEPATD
jgi:thiol-disulfide isomerase/thioredoxin